MNVVEVAGLVKRFKLKGREIKALDEVGFNVAAGESVGFIGQNGAGKSTTIKILFGAIRADAGTALLMGRSAEDPQSRVGVGYVPENPYLPLLLGFAFALAARGLGPTIDHLRSARSDPLHEALFSPVLEHAYTWLPDLSRLDWRALSLYSLTPDTAAMALAALNALAYILLLLTLAAMIFQRRNFI